jgi:hypothetical protein
MARHIDAFATTGLFPSPQHTTLWLRATPHV